MIKALKILLITVLVLVAIAAAVTLRPSYTKDDLKFYWQPPSQFLTLPSGAVAHYRDQGNPNGPALLMLHGGFDNLHSWEPWVKSLGKDYRMVSVDLPGHGLTGRIPGDVYTRDNLAAFVQEFVVALGLERFTLAGNSMGGGIANVYTLDYPERVNGLILLGAGGLFQPEEIEGDNFFSIDSDEISKPGGPWNTDTSVSLMARMLRYLTIPGGVEAVLPYMFEDDSVITPAMIKRYEDILRYEDNRYARMTFWRHYYANVPADDLASRFHEVKIPTLLMWGDKDILVPVERAYQFDKAIDDTTLVIYEDVGHAPMIEIPERTAQDVDRFIQEKALK